MPPSPRPLPAALAVEPAWVKQFSVAAAGPEQIWIAYGATPDAMTIGWVSLLRGRFSREPPRRRRLHRAAESPPRARAADVEHVRRDDGAVRHDIGLLPHVRQRQQHLLHVREDHIAAPAPRLDDGPAAQHHHLLHHFLMEEVVIIHPALCPSGLLPDHAVVIILKVLSATRCV